NTDQEFTRYLAYSAPGSLVALPNNGSVCCLPIQTGIGLRNGKGLGSNCPWQMRNVFGR
uniref:Uncharacterized protein n=1 Tax=Cairina moschata TaxID=8855 RepID=A0A8C3BHZ0_CAIMO